ncbi:MAG: surface-adhesin E family protein [Ignavibacteriales bacterium]
MRRIFVLTCIVFISQAVYSQGTPLNWIQIIHQNNSDVRIDTSTIKRIGNDEILVWGLETYKAPIQIDSVSNKVYRVKTHYLINKNLLRYSILEIVYYDNKNNLLEEFSYSQDNEQSDGYPYPVLPHSGMESILINSIEHLRIKHFGTN